MNLHNQPHTSSQIHYVRVRIDPEYLLDTNIVNAQKLDAVLPLMLKDYARFEILQKSFKVFCKDLGKCWIVTLDHEFEQIKALVSDEQYCVIAESSLVPEFKIFRSSNRFSIFKSLPGWFKQQVIKIAIADKIETDFYITLDSDIICTKPVYYQDLIRDGRAVCYIHRTHDHHDWYGWGEKVLNIHNTKNRDFLHNVTPVVINKHAMLELQTYLTQVYHTKLSFKPGDLNAVVLKFLTLFLPKDSARRERFALKRRDLRVAGLKLLTLFLPKNSTFRSQLLTWKSYLSASDPWTEYGLYYLFLEETNRFDHYHVEIANCTYTQEDSVWYKEDFEVWDVEKVFSPKSNHFFVIVQGWLGLDVQEVWQKVGRYLNESTVSR